MKRTYYIIEKHHGMTTCHGKIETTLDSLSVNSMAIIKAVIANEVDNTANNIRLSDESMAASPNEEGKKIRLYNNLT